MQLYKLTLVMLIAVVSCFKEKDMNQYIIMSTSKFWFNVRQGVNALMIYQSLKDMGIKDENILLLIPEPTACNSKNNKPGVMCPFDGQTFPNIYRNVELDYKQNDVTIKLWVDLLRGKYSKYTPQSKRLKLNNQRKLIVYSTGHGGDGYMKMQDTQYLLDFEMAKVVKEMDFLKMFKETFFISDSCSAITLYETIDTPNVLALGSSSFDEKSYSHGKDKNLLISKTDRFSFANYNFFNSKFKLNPKISLAEMLKEYDPAIMNCHAKLVNQLASKKNETQVQTKKTYHSIIISYKDSSQAYYKINNILTERPTDSNEKMKWDLLQELGNLKQIKLPQLKLQREPIQSLKKSLIFTY